MNTIVEYALPVIATMSPVLVLAGINAWFWMWGERDTLLLPGVRGLAA